MTTNTALQTTRFNELDQNLAAVWTNGFCLLGGMICVFIWLSHTRRPTLATSTANTPDPSPPTRKGVYLEEVTCNRAEVDTDIDIIAIHGLDTSSRDTWTWKDPGDPKNRRNWVNWLDQDMLPASVDRVRIFTCDWPADLLIPSDLIQKTIEEYALLLLDGIESALFAGSTRQRGRPIVFIASCLGGLVLIMALVHADDKRSRYYRLRESARGIVFLATPFRGTSFQDVAAWAETGLRAKASIQGRVLVDRSSATLDIIRDPLPLDRPHSLMNKFRGSQCPDYQRVASKIRGMVENILAGTLLEQADTWIRDKHYTADRLKIERLSGELLAMDQCYINLAIVEQPGQSAGRRKESRETTASPFSILDRQKITVPDKTIQVKLSEVFSERKGRDGLPIHPRRILIRGRAGVGKTTLCKKIIYEFTKGTWSQWNELFDRVLWVPLRNLKHEGRRMMPVYSFADLLSHEFSLPTNQPNLAGELSSILDARSGKTLFLLDGLDEVSQDLTGDVGVARFFTELLSQPNIIVTTRPSAKPPVKLDLELETIGFGPDQVDEYIEKSFMNPKTTKTDQGIVNNVRSFLQKHWLIQGLIRIPIQLDALCYTWEEFDQEAVPSTMTRIYDNIVQKLWKKDIIRLEKIKEGYAKVSHAAEIDQKVTAEIALVECLAFNGLYHDIIDFTPEYRASMVNLCPLQDLPLDETLSRLSFLRTSDTFSNTENRNYHFIHLTFQEYFAARYFVRRWKNDEGQLWTFTFGSKDTNTKISRPKEFLQKHKYTARYDLFWRFVAGLLDGREQALEFMNTIEKEPLDLLGPTHQRLVMHCLSEISSSLLRREDLENRLAQWLLFECRFNQSARLATEVEFPEGALKTALLCEASENQAIILSSLAERTMIPLSIIEHVAGRLDDEDADVRRAAVRALCGRSALPDEVLGAVAGRLGDEDKHVRIAAIRALGGRLTLPYEVLAAAAARLNDDDLAMRIAAVEALGRRSALPDNILVAVAERLDDDAPGVRKAVVEVLGGRSALSDAILAAVARRLDDEDSTMRSATIMALGRRPTLPNELLVAVVGRLVDGDEDVRSTASWVLRGRPALPGEVLSAVAGRLDDQRWYVRRGAVEALGRRSTLPDEMLAAVMGLLDDDNSAVRRAVVETLGGKSALTDKVLAAMAARLDDEDSLVRWTVIQALGGKSVLPTNILAAVVGRLNDECWYVRRAAVRTLGRKSTLPNKVLAAVAKRLDDSDEDVRSITVVVLGRTSTLPNDVLMAVARRLDDEDWDVRRAAVEALGRRSTLPDKMLAAVAGRLDDKDSDVRWVAVEELGGRSALSAEMLAAVARRLNDKVLDVRCATIKVLGERSVLPGEVLAALARRLYDKNSTMRRAAVEALGGRSALPDAILEAIVGRLDDQDSDVRSAAVDFITSANEKLYHIGPLIASLHKALLERSFREQTSWYIEQCTVCVNLPDSIRELNIDMQQNDVKEWINGVQPAEYPWNIDEAAVGETVFYSSDIWGSRKMKLREDLQTAPLRFSISKEAKHGGHRVTMMET
ncbi:hypothetical protein PWT90_00333 [Aphanocladium album]|nr:hypothetical protein PWT90_00333 [Aphanocladium album]